MMINMIQLKQVLRNKRFLLFTIFIPVTWYIFLYNIQQGIVPNIMLGIAVFIGIIGNIGFYSFESKFTKYSVKKYLLDQTFVQIVLNSLIFIVVLGIAVAFFKFPITGNLAIQFLLLTMMGIYFSIIGFVLGVRLDSQILDTVSFPIIILASMTIIPFATLGAKEGFIGLVSKLQMIFPGYYYTNIINSISSGKEINLTDFILFVTVFILNILPLYFLVPKVKFVKAK